VSELIELLRGFDADAEVVITTRPNEPMEHALAGVATRADLDAPAASLAAGLIATGPMGAAANDVILVEGRWLRYGALAVWDTARRRRGDAG
jgi:hypothetical protein